MYFGKMVDMALMPKEQEKDSPAPIGYSMPLESGAPVYPWGLSITLGDEQLEKLGLEPPEVGDLLDSRMMLKVTSVSVNETTSGKCCRVEAQIIMMAVEDEESEELPQSRRKLRPLTYKT